MPSQTQFTVPLTGVPRPPLPLEHLNPHIKTFDSANVPTVKFQEIIREGQSTIVARMKVPTPSGHAFILRRLDTGAISLTTMFRAAFPTASDESERVEANWVKANYDNSGGNRAGKARFAGTWVTTDVAITIADEYSLGKIIPPLTDAKPDPNTEYRKSSRAQQQQQQTPDKDSPAPKQLPTPSPSMPAPNPPKRRREASPAPSKTPSIASSSPVKSPLSPILARRSQRTISPAPPPTPKPLSQKGANTPKSPKVSRSPLKTRRLEVVTPAGSDETAVDDEVADVPEPDINEDIREQKEMIEAFKAQREAQLRAGDEDTAMVEGAEKKREREDENASLEFNFKEPESQERQIATNRRIARLPEMTPERKSFAWGVAVFAAAVGAMTYLPNPWL
ncbi:hypothetical protein EDB92DRAFT_1847760 [Lactarius akahatsu]|uniref:HTH APSES-type domain-containing protein n=1 Tax=Lactarius akahatsu TaxID=416441 RepID=A0AAD4QF80_9AGAM|nr:hypothetical protein EDB92DRAFT_1847760 [Lactarius akahatsu]